MLTDKELDAWIEREFAGYGVAIRTKEEAAIPGEPFMSMTDAKELTRRAVAAFASAAPEEGMTMMVECSSGEAFPTALSPDSRKAEPVAWSQRPSVFPEGPTPSYTHVSRVKTGPYPFPLYAALAPATEDGGREALAELIKAADDSRFSSEAIGIGFRARLGLIRALSPFPISGTGTQPVASASPPTWLGDEGSGP